MDRNMKALYLASLAITAMLLTTMTYAEPYFSNAQSSKSGAGRIATPIQPMSSSDFKSQVNSLTRQNQQALSQQAKVAPTQPSSASQASAPQSTNSTNNDMNTQAAPVAASQQQASPGVAPPQATYQPQTPNTPPPQTQGSQSSQEYMGFSGGKSENNSSSSSGSNKQSSGWNIQY